MLKQIRKTNPLLAQVLLRAQEVYSYVPLRFYSVERWNWPDEFGNAPNVARADGYFDVEGHSWCDIAVQYPMQWYSINDISWFFSDSWFWLKEWWRYGGGFASAMRRPFRSTKYPTVFTLTSFMVQRSDAADDRAWKAAGDPPDDGRDFLDSINNPSEAYKEWFSSWNGIRMHHQESLTDEQVEAFMLAEQYIKVSDGVYISTSDAGGIAVNESVVFPFDLKSGWSEVKIAEILEFVTKSYYGLDSKVLVSSEPIYV